MDLSQRAEQAQRITLIGVLVNVILMVIKFAAGLLGNSQAMIADAIHTLSDFATDFAVLIGIRYAKKPIDEDHAYGHGKYETVAAMLVGLILFLVGIRIGWNAIHSIFDVLHGKVLARPSQIAFWAAILSIIFKEILFRKTLLVGRRTQNDAIVANAWHHRSDAMSSVGTAIGIGAATFLGNEWTIMDPVAAIVVSFLLLKVAFDIVKDQLGCLTEQSLSQSVHEEIKQLALSLPDVFYPHNLRTRTVGKTVVIDLHIRVNPDMKVSDAHAVATSLEDKLRTHFGADLIANIHIEPLKPDVLTRNRTRSAPPRTMQRQS